jgi:hypothetical protein
VGFCDCLLTRQVDVSEGGRATGAERRLEAPNLLNGLKLWSVVLSVLGTVIALAIDNAVSRRA